MKIAVLSGKGGAGKTLVATNLALLVSQTGRAVSYLDCDVEEPNGRIFLRPQDLQTLPVSTKLPQFDEELCSGCRRCVDFCRFNALFFVKRKPRVFPEICHSCGGCQLVCPSQAITEVDRPVGQVELGRREQLRIITGILQLGEASAVPVISAVLAQARPQELTIIDGPPGSSCSVMESVAHVDYCLLVVEPTAFGLHNFAMVRELAQLLGKPCGVVVNKADQSYPPLEEYCRQEQLPILARLPYEQQLAASLAEGQLAVEQSSAWRHRFQDLWEQLSVLEQEGGARP